MVLLGLTGSIAMGKSVAARSFRCLGVPVFDADATVHRLFQPGGAAVAPVLAAFPGSGDASGGIDRRALGRLVFGNEPALRRLEAIVHPLVREAQRRFLAAGAAQRTPLVVLDIPLLFETGGAKLVDAVAVVSAPAFLQAQRVLRRPGMTPARFAAILARQVPDEAKRKRADFVIKSGLSKRHATAAVAGIIDQLRQRPGRAWPARWPAAASSSHSPSAQIG